MRRFEHMQAATSATRRPAFNRYLSESCQNAMQGRLVRDGQHVASTPIGPVLTGTLDCPNDQSLIQAVQIPVSPFSLQIHID
jgi:hypothetical protein